MICRYLVMARWNQKRRDAETLEERRLSAAPLFRKGVSDSDIARRVGVTPQAVHRWHLLFERGGADALKKSSHTGRPPALTEPQKKKLAKLLLAGAVASGYPTDLWTTERVRGVVRRKFGMTYTTVGVWKLLHKMGFSWQRPKRRARERDEKVIATWLTDTWPNLKKRGTGEGR